MNSQKMVSVCVPCYERPEMLQQLIKSFLNQDYAYKELVISDDSLTDLVKKLVLSFGSSEIKYFQNESNIGYSKNLLQSMLRATGNYIVVLGDDDLLLSPKTLSRYAEVFDNYPGVSYVYSNQIQFSDSIKVEYLYASFKDNILFHSGEDAMKHIWTSSTFIPGLAIRNTTSLRDLYPKEDMLFPQLELVGHLVNQKDAYGISDVLIAGRAHSQQLGFFALKGERIKGGEQYGAVEYFTIFDRLVERYNLDFDSSFLSHDLVNHYFTMGLKAKTIVDRKYMVRYYKAFIELSPIARKSIKLRLSFLVALLTPTWTIRMIRWIAIRIVRIKNLTSFQAWEIQLKKMVDL